MQRASQRRRACAESQSWTAFRSLRCGAVIRWPYDLAVVSPPIIVSATPECWFYRSSGDALAMGIPAGAKVFDGTGQRLEVVGGDLSVLPGDRDGTEELTEILSHWLM